MGPIYGSNKINGEGAGLIWAVDLTLLSILKYLGIYKLSMTTFPCSKV